MTDDSDEIEFLTDLISKANEALDHSRADRESGSPAPDPPSDTETPVEWVGIRTVPIDVFVAVDEPGAGAVLGPPDAPVIPKGGNVMVYGDYGVGKTTLVDDLAFHLAAGDDWLGIAVPKARRVLIVENESPRPHYRKKLARKTAAWKGSPLDDRLRVYEHPWGGFSFADAEQSQLLADEIARHEIDVVMVGPLTSVGFDKPGTIPETREFGLLVDRVRRLSGRPVVFVLIHHENARGKVSGAWGGVGEALLHVTQQGHGHLRLYFEKARWSSERHQTALALVWADGDSFAVEDKPEIDDDTLADLIVDAIANDPGTGWSKVEKATPGVAAERRRRVRDQLLRDGVIVNVAKNENGEIVVMRECPERKAAHLHPADDPTIAHLRLSRDADATQTASLWGEEGRLSHLRPASGPIRTQEVETQTHTPAASTAEGVRERLDRDAVPDADVDDDEIERLADRAREWEGGGS